MDGICGRDRDGRDGGGVCRIAWRGGRTGGLHVELSAGVGAELAPGLRRRRASRLFDGETIRALGEPLF